MYLTTQLRSIYNNQSCVCQRLPVVGQSHDRSINAKSTYYIIIRPVLRRLVMSLLFVKFLHCASLGKSLMTNECVLHLVLYHATDCLLNALRLSSKRIVEASTVS